MTNQQQINMADKETSLDIRTREAIEMAALYEKTRTPATDAWNKARLALPDHILDFDEWWAVHKEEFETKTAGEV